MWQCHDAVSKSVAFEIWEPTNCKAHRSIMSSIALYVSLNALYVIFEHNFGLRWCQSTNGLRTVLFFNWTPAVNLLARNTVPV
jgi:hypothetical protein